MLACARPKVALLLLLAGLLAPVPTYAGTYDSVVKDAELMLQDDDYLLFADIQYRLSPRAIEALKNGIPLFWRVDIEIKRRRDFLWDESILAKQLRFKIQYQALLNIYRVHNEDNGEGGNFSSLVAALDALSSIHYVPVLKQSVLRDDERYEAGVRVVFERELLPLPLRTFAYLNSQWYLSSDWYSWELKN